MKPHQGIEHNLRKKNFQHVVGCDEAGRGSWAGPVIAGAVILPDEINLPGLNDSKLLSPTKRQKLVTAITSQSVAWGIGMVSATELDEIGLSKATHRAFDRALVQLHHPIDYILIDGQGFEFRTPFSCVVHGDQTVASIAAASILAKVYRDHVMCFLDQLFPGYDFAKHKGYGTKQHQNRLQHLGVSMIHRKSYKPVATLFAKSKV